MQLGGRTRRKTTAGGAHLLEAGSLTGLAHGDRTHARPKSSSESLASSVQRVSHRVISLNASPQIHFSQTCLSPACLLPRCFFLPFFMGCSPRQRWNWTWQVSPEMEPNLTLAGTGAILAQGTHWALATKLVFCPFTSSMLQSMGL